MRIVLGIACLIGLFALSSVWHEQRKDRFRHPSEDAVLARERQLEEPGWGEVRIGSASDAAPVFLRPERPRGAPARRAAETADGYGYAEPTDAEPVAGDWELSVKSGDVLSEIVRLHYGRVSPDLEERLARYNGLASPDKLKVGQTLYLPTEERLVAETD